MLAVRLGQADEAALVRQMQQGGGYAIEWADGTWSEGQWQDFNPTRTPNSMICLPRGKTCMRHAVDEIGPKPWLTCRVAPLIPGFLAD